MKMNARIAFQSRGSDIGDCPILYLRAQRLINRGCKVFFVTMVAKPEQSPPGFTQILVVKDIADALLDEVP